jgi:hypothetical protein
MVALSNFSVATWKSGLLRQFDESRRYGAEVGVGFSLGNKKMGGDFSRPFLFLLICALNSLCF